jgi:hypothetical protein
MSDLTGLSIASTFDRLLTLPSGGGDTTTLVPLTDGNGVNTFALQISSAGIKSTGTLEVTGNVDFNGDLDVEGTSNLDDTDIDGTFTMDGSAFDVNATTTCAIDNANTSNGVTIGTNTNSMPITIGHATSEVTVGDNLTITGQFACNGQSVAAAPNYTISNLSTDRALDCDSTSDAEVADVLGQVITDLIAIGIFQ